MNCKQVQAERESIQSRRITRLNDWPRDVDRIRLGGPLDVSILVGRVHEMYHGTVGLWDELVEPTLVKDPY